MVQSVQTQDGEELTRKQFCGREPKVHDQPADNVMLLLEQVK